MCRTIRVLWLIDSLTAGGAEALTSSLVRSTRSGALDLRVVCLKSIQGNPFERELREGGVRVRNLQTRNLRDVAAFRRLLRTIEADAPDLIHAHLTYASIWGSLAARLEKLPLVVTLHTLPEREVGWSRQMVRQRLAHSLLQRHAAVVITVSKAAREAYRAETRLDSSLLRVLHNGVDVASLSADRDARRQTWRTANQIGASQRVATAVAVLRAGKGIADLLQAAREVVDEHPAILFLIVGEGPERARLEEMCRTLRLEKHVRWLGHRHDVGEILAASDLFVLPSHGEALPTVLLEAMATGVPAIATSVGGVVEIAGTSRCVELVPPGRPDELARAISDLLQDESLSEHLATAAQKRAREAFSLQTWIAGLTSLYREVLGVENAAQRAPAVVEGI